MGRVTFVGAAGSVTGSCTHLAWGDTELLVDCGLYQGDDALEQRNREPFRFTPARLAGVVLTHAHLDHSGLLPRLVAAGFAGPIWCTPPTRALVRLVLEDAGRLQEEEARFARRSGHSRHADPQPLYTLEQARAALRLIATVPFDEERELVPGVRLRFRRAGHLLGAASVELAAKGADGERRTWCFSGDVGRYGVPVLRDPEPPLAAPHGLLLESTYGDRRHPEGDPQPALAEVIERVFARGGKVVIPAFALGRTQDLLYHLDALADAGRVDPSTVFLDSPMATRATAAYLEHAADLDEDLGSSEDAAHALAAGRFQVCRTVDESKALNFRSQPAVIIAGNGMATGGRVVHHLHQTLPDPRNALLFVGFQAAGTRGRALLEGAETTAIHGRPLRVRAQVLQLPTLSAHADAGELVRWCRALPTPPRVVALNHGEDPARKALAASLADELGWPRPLLPMPGDEVPW